MTPGRFSIGGYPAAGFPATPGFVVSPAAGGGAIPTPPSFVNYKTSQHLFGFPYIDVALPDGTLDPANVGALLIVIRTGYNPVTMENAGWSAPEERIGTTGDLLDVRVTVWTRVVDGTEPGFVRIDDEGDSDVASSLLYRGWGDFSLNWNNNYPTIGDAVTTPRSPVAPGDRVVSIWNWEEINTSAPLTVTQDRHVTPRIPKSQWDQSCQSIGDEIIRRRGLSVGRTATAVNTTSGASRVGLAIVLTPA